MAHRIRVLCPAKKITQQAEISIFECVLAMQPILEGMILDFCMARVKNCKLQIQRVKLCNPTWLVVLLGQKLKELLTWLSLVNLRLRSPSQRKHAEVCAGGCVSRLSYNKMKKSESCLSSNSHRICIPSTLA